MNPFQAFRGRVGFFALECLLSYLIDIWHAGSDTSLRVPQRIRKRRPRAYPGHFGQSTDTDCLHLLCDRATSSCHVHHL